MNLSNVIRRGRLIAAGVMMMLLSGAILLGWSRWAAAAGWALNHWPALLLAGVGAVLVSIGVKIKNAQLADGGRRGPLSWWVIAAGIGMVTGVVWSATEWLLDEAERAKDPAAARVEAVKTGLGIGAGTGGVLALLLAMRRQWHHEITAVDTTNDATERRITELYSTAVEQLGSDKAPIRLGGLYALERLAQNNRGQQQTIVNVLCAYLRMPYAPPVDPQPDAHATVDLSAHGKMIKDHSDNLRELVQEREVRLAAQRVIARHLDADSVETFWSEIDLDLTGATLIDFDLGCSTINNSTFTKACFTGHTQFFGTTFTGNASFDMAVFVGYAQFNATEFKGKAEFSSATFRDEVTFGGARFGARHYNDTPLRFACFDKVRFTGAATFGRATFYYGADFHDSVFNGNADFNSTRFGSVNFTNVALSMRCRCNRTTLAPWTDFTAAKFKREVPDEVVPYVAPLAESGSTPTGDHYGEQATR